MRILNKKSYTLLEVILVLSMIALLALISVPLFSNTMNQWNLETEARKVSAMLKKAQQASKTEQKEYAILGSLSGDTFSYGEWDGAAFNPGETYFLRHGIDLTSSTVWSPLTRMIRFDHRGAPVPFGGLFRLEAPDGTQMTIRIDSTTGRIRIQ